MPRIARVIATGYPHHIVQRGNRHQEVFFADEDHGEYLNFYAKETSAKKEQTHQLSIVSPDLQFLLDK